MGSEMCIRDSARCLRHILRQDPDVVMVGEIRDLETAEIAAQASLTGHIVFTTLHTNDAPSSIARLLDLGVEPFLITATLEGIIAQRLVRKICDKCKIIRRKGIVRVICVNPKHKQRQG